MPKGLKQFKFFFLKFLLNNFGKSEKSASKIPKVRGGSEAFGKNSYLSILFYLESFPKYVAIFLNCLDPLKLNSEKKNIIGLKVGLLLFSILKILHIIRVKLTLETANY